VKRLIKTVTFDLHKSMFRKTYLFQCVLIACVCMISQVDILRNMYMGFSMQGYDLIGVYNFIIHYDRFKILLLVIVASVYSGSFCREYHSNSLRYILQRSGIKFYVLSKYISILVSGLTAYIAGLICALMIWRTKIPFVEPGMAFFGTDQYFSFESLTPREHPFLWLTATAVLSALSMLLLCCAGFYISLYLKDIFIIICMPAVLYFCFTGLSSLFPELFFLPSYGNNVALISGHMWLNYGYKVCVNLCGIAAFGILSYKKMKGMQNEGAF